MSVHVQQLAANLIGFACIALLVVWGSRARIIASIEHRIAQLDRNTEAGQELGLKMVALGERVVDLGHDLNDTNARLADVTTQLVRLVADGRHLNESVQQIRKAVTT